MYGCDLVFLKGKNIETESMIKDCRKVYQSLAESKSNTIKKLNDKFHTIFTPPILLGCLQGRRVCSTDGIRTGHKFTVSELERKRHLQRSRRTRDDNIKKNEGNRIRRSANSSCGFGSGNVAGCFIGP